MAVKKQSIAKASAGVQEALENLDVDMVGVARRKDFKGTRLEESALSLLPETRSIVVVAAEVYPEFLDLTSPERVMGSAPLNDLYTRHVDYLRGRLTRAVYDVARASHKDGLKALPLTAQGPAVDGRFLEAVISYKHAAEVAGLGNIGMSSLLVTEQFGPRVNFAVCLTEAALKSTARELSQNCRYCNVCVSKCPAHALGWPKNDERYVINRFACRTYIDAAGGCSECMKQCPVASPRYA
jgi:epoxyqueuosine reductase QueG